MEKKKVQFKIYKNKPKNRKVWSKDKSLIKKK